MVLKYCSKLKRDSIFKFILYIILLIGAFISIFPLLWMFFSSFKTPAEVMAYPPTVIPKNPTIQNYRELFTRMNFGIYIRNSIFIVLVKTSIILYTSALVGYVLGKIKFWGRNLIFISILATMMIPWPVVIIPLYQLMLKFKWVNTYWSIIVPSVFSTFGIFMMRQFVITIPDDLVDAARIDGASQFRIFHSIILPQLTPALSALGIFNFLFIWDDFLWPYIMLIDEKLYTIPIGLALFTGRYYVNTAGFLAGASLAVMPVLIFYMLCQRRFVEGMTFTGMKE
ncbi:MAG: carbohydrate ABC transporter permease [Actinobacteria bacterium]|nr:carbohydrate ABC transporter permease [Actinomycetota bacterium]